jgi:Holliday junction resolvase RusA-like endonuclease
MAITYTTHEGKAYQEHIRKLMLERQAWYRSATTIGLKAVICFRDNRRRDISNYIKVLEDSLMNGNVFEDDKQVEALEFRRGPNIVQECVLVTVEEILSDRETNLRWIKGRL